MVLRIPHTRWANLGAVLITFAASTLTADEVKKAAVETETVHFKGSSGEIQGFLARPEGSGPYPAIVVIHEWWGLTDWVKQNAERLAAQGYVALAVDLYGGKVTKDPNEAHELMRALNQKEAVANLEGGVAYLDSLAFVAKDKKIGVIGWCMGGSYSRELAQAAARIGPTVICYGSVTTDPDQLQKLRDNPVLGIFGATDRGITVSSVKEFTSKLKAAQGQIDLQVYEGAGHGFMRPGGAQYNEKAARDAWAKIEAFFKSNL